METTSFTSTASIDFHHYRLVPNHQTHSPLIETKRNAARLTKKQYSCRLHSCLEDFISLVEWIPRSLLKTGNYDLSPLLILDTVLCSPNTVYIFLPVNSGILSRQAW